MNILSIDDAIIKLNTLLPNDIHILNNAFKNDNFKLFIVGGAVRDVFLNKIPKDFDVCTNATPTEIINILNINNIPFNVQGEHFGIVVAKLIDDIEIATFRTDTSTNTGNNQDTIVKFGATIEEDIQRRDITINALLFDISTNSIIDLIGGIDDLKNNIIRSIGNPVDRFKEDNIRKLRVCRFSTRLNFEIHEDTFNAIKNDISLNVSEERIINELVVAFNNTPSKNKLKDILFETKLIFSIFPGMILCNNTIDESFTFEEFLATILFPNELVEENLIKLKLPTKTINTILFFHELSFKFLNDEIINPLWFFKTCKNLTINQFNLFEQHRIKLNWLMKFEPDKTLAKTLMDNGITGIELGKKIDQHYLNLFHEKFIKYV